MALQFSKSSKLQRASSTPTHEEILSFLFFYRKNWIFNVLSMQRKLIYDQKEFDNWLWKSKKKWELISTCLLPNCEKYWPLTRKISSWEMRELRHLYGWSSELDLWLWMKIEWYLPRNCKPDHDSDFVEQVCSNVTTENGNCWRLFWSKHFAY